MKFRGPVPFGYKKENGVVVEIPEELEALEEIKDLIKDKAISLREGSVWLEFRTGRKLSYQGLKNKIDKDARLGN
jgi:hypothetical protein|tara:strand:- start:369 stop:593 length:225 start_codon:yes stop_codon:yes gene_type:complete